MFKPKFTKADVQRMLQKRLQVVERVIIDRLQYVGETFVRNARLDGNYNDLTGNLRSSVGYIVLKHGDKVAGSNFEPSGKGSDKTTGSTKGKSFINDISADFSQGYVLIVVAGMEYAAAVESRGKDVLTGSSTQATTDLKKAIDKVKAKLNKRT